MPLRWQQDENAEICANTTQLLSKHTFSHDSAIKIEI